MTTDVKINAINAILNEHGKLSAVIQGMAHFSKMLRSPHVKIDLKVFRAMIFYISEYPEKMHHPKEDQYLFRLVRHRSSKAATTLLELEEQHQHGETAVRELEHSLLRVEFCGAAAVPAFQEQVERYTQLYLQHIRLEEEVILPLAEQVLLGDDWREIDAAFGSNSDPLRARDLASGFDKLYSTIVDITPAPFGLGDEIRRTGS